VRLLLHSNTSFKIKNIQKDVKVKRMPSQPAQIATALGEGGHKITYYISLF
jgi:hypothetical protein